MDLLSYLRILRRRWALILAVTIAGAAIGVGTAYASSSGGDEGRFYKATHLMFLDTTSEDSSSSAFSNLDQIAILATTGDVPVEVGKELGEEGQRLGEHIIVTTNSVTSTLDITAIAETPRGAEEIADTFGDELVASLNQKDQERFDASRDRIVSRLDEIQTEIATIDAQVAAGGGDVVKAQRDALVNNYRLTYEQFQQLAETGSPVTLLSTLEAASSVPIGKSEYDERLELGQLGENLRQVGPSTGEETDDQLTSSPSNLGGPVSRGVFGGFLGLLLGAGIAIAMEHLDRRLRTRDDVEEAYQEPVLADIPILSKHQRASQEVLSHTAPLSRTAEAHRAIRSALIFQHVTNQRPGSNGEGNEIASTAAFMTDDDLGASDSLVVLITSALPNEGKTTTTANLAAVFAESGASVLAVNCDFRRPSLHRYLGAEHVPRKVQGSNIPGVALVSGVVSDPAANPGQIIAAQRQVVATARERFDVILLDTAPLLTTNDAIEIVPVVDGCVIVARAGVTTVDGAERTRTLLERVSAPITGAVLVGAESVSNDEYYYYAQPSAVAAAQSVHTKTDEPVAGAGSSEPAAGPGDAEPDEDDVEAIEAVQTDGGDAASVEGAGTDDVVTWVSESDDEAEYDEDKTEEIAVVGAGPEPAKARKRRRFRKSS